MKEGALWMAVVILACFVGPLNRDRYQATSIGKQAFVIDKHTGEAWISIQSNDPINNSNLELVPVYYEKGGQWSFGSYDPEKSRNDEHADWNTWFKRKLRSSSQD